MTDNKNKICSQCGCNHAQRLHYHFVLNTGADQAKQDDAPSGTPHKLGLARITNGETTPLYFA